MSIFCYQHHINDWRKETASLSLEQRGAYRELMDWFYVTEGRLPAEEKSLFRMLGAQKLSEKKAIKFVIERFFKPSENGFLTQTRCVFELNLIQNRSKTASENARKKQAVYLENNKLGQADAVPQLSHGSANQEPITNNQYKKEESPLPPKGGDDGVKKSKKIIKKPELPEWLQPEVWTTFCDHRKSIKKPITPQAEKLLLGELLKLKNAGNSPIDVINQSIMKGWTGLFELKDTHNSTPLQQETHTETRWKSRIDGWNKSKFWIEPWGPRPDSPEFESQTSMPAAIAAKTKPEASPTRETPQKDKSLLTAP